MPRAPALNMYRQVGILCLAASLSGCSGDTPWTGRAGLQTIAERDLVAISILSPTAWWLRVDSDGSGQIGFGSAMQDTASFTSGTFRLGDLGDLLTAACSREGNLERDAAVTFVAAMGRSAESLYCADPALIAGIFDHAVEGADLKGSRLHTLYTIQPPVRM